MISDERLEACIEAIPAVMAGTRCVHCGLPLTDGICNVCFPPSQPSREFLIGQAIANAAAQIDTIGYGPGRQLEILGLPGLLRCLLAGDFVHPALVRGVRAEFTKMVSA